MSDESPQESLGSYLAIFSVVIPGLLASGFMPDWNVLGFGAWLAIATVGAAIGSAIALERRVLGLIAGALGGAGALLGLHYYVDVRSALTGSNTFHSLELLLGGGVGALPGVVLYFAVAGHNETDQGADENAD